jgi:hypothetical protein
MNRKTVYTIAIVILMFFLFFNPFDKKKEGNVPSPYLRGDTLEEITTYFTANYQSPEEYLAGKFRNHSLVFLGEFGRVQQQVDVVNRAIPVLYKQGVTTMGIEFALYEDTPRIDKILTAPSFDEAAVQEVLFNRMVLWGFKEYVELFRTAWKVNSERGDGEAPFRIVGLSVPVSWEYLVDERDMKKPEVIAQVYDQGIPDVFMAETIIREFVQKDVKALIYVSLQHAFTKFIVTEYAKSARDIGLADDRRAGNIVFDRIGEKAATVIFHAPWPDNRAQTLVTHPVEGALDKLMEEIPEEMYFAGFDTNGTPFGELDSERNDFAKGHEDLIFGDICDGYIITGPIAGYEPVGQIPGFVDEKNLAEAILRFPGPNIDPITVEEMNTYIGSILESTKAIFDRF